MRMTSVNASIILLAFVFFNYSAAVIGATTSDYEKSESGLSKRNLTNLRTEVQRFYKRKVASSNRSLSTKPPSDSTKSPSDSTKSPSDSTKFPSDSTKSPSDSTKSPSYSTKSPSWRRNKRRLTGNLRRGQTFYKRRVRTLSSTKSPSESKKS